jgi:hypothetical protein
MGEVVWIGSTGHGTVKLSLVKAPKAHRCCRACGRELSAIERWCGCGELRLMAGMDGLSQRNRFRMNAKARLLASVSRITVR